MQFHELGETSSMDPKNLQPVFVYRWRPTICRPRNDYIPFKRVGLWYREIIAVCIGHLGFLSTGRLLYISLVPHQCHLCCAVGADGNGLDRVAP
jgi:hypothetical protein